MKKKLIIVLIIISVIMITGGVIYSSVKHQKNPKEKLVEKESLKKVVDGNMTNVEATFYNQHIYSNKYRFKNNRVVNIGPYYVYVATVDNISNEELEHTHLTITFISNTKKVLGIDTLDIPPIPANGSVEVSIEGANKKIFEAFDFKLSKKEKGVENITK